jgi:hypothetical protein
MRDNNLGNASGEAVL